MYELFTLALGILFVLLIIVMLASGIILIIGSFAAFLHYFLGEPEDVSSKQSD